MNELYLAHYGVKGMSWDPRKRKHRNWEYDENGNLINNPNHTPASRVSAHTNNPPMRQAPTQNAPSRTVYDDKNKKGNRSLNSRTPLRSAPETHPDRNPRLRNAPERVSSRTAGFGAGIDRRNRLQSRGLNSRTPLRSAPETHPDRNPELRPLGNSRKPQKRESTSSAPRTNIRVNTEFQRSQNVRHGREIVARLLK